MKKSFYTALFLLVATMSFAQTDGLSYQAIIIDNNAQEIPGINVTGNYLSEGEIALRFTIYDEFYVIEYQEVHETITDQYGMVNLLIGQGEVTGSSPGQFNEIDWDGSPKDLVVELSVEGSGFEEFSHQQLLFIPYVYHRDIYASGTLTVEGESVLNDSFTVANQSLTTLTGDLIVQGTATFEGDAFFENITVADWSMLHGTLTVGDSAMLNSSLQVEGASVLEGSLTANSTSDLNGQVTIDATLSGGDNNYDAYPLRVQGSNQGVAIKVNSSTPNGNNNFITFFDGQGEAVGRVEGQTAGEVASSPEYIYQTAMLTANVAIATSNVVGATTSSTVCAGAGACVTAPIPSLTVTSAANLVLTVANLTAYQIFAYANLGVTYESGSADYAEWLKRAHASEKMSYGDIVSVKGGEISKNTDFGEQMMVVSVNPAVLGNMPPEGEKHLYEKVAFLGQVPVKVKGTVQVGDYILPGGGSDGFGVAVAPSDMKIDDFSKIVGVAWSASDDQVSNYVNVAIGMNKNDLVHVVSNQQTEITALRNEIDEMHELLAELVPGYAEKRGVSKETGQSPTPAATVRRDVQEEPSAEEMHLPLDRSMFVSGLEIVKEQLRDQGIEVNTHPVYRDIFNDEESVNKIIDEAMRIATEQRERAISIDQVHGYR